MTRWVRRQNRGPLGLRTGSSHGAGWARWVALWLLACGPAGCIGPGLEPPEGGGDSTGSMVPPGSAGTGGAGGTGGTGASGMSGSGPSGGSGGSAGTPSMGAAGTGEGGMDAGLPADADAGVDASDDEDAGALR